VVIFEDDEQERVKNLFRDATMLFCLDYSAPSRVGDAMANMIRQFQPPIVMIDHHQGKEDFADFELWRVEAAATCELVFDFIEMMEDKKLMDIPIAECLYAGIMTDTGSFKFASTSSRIHRIAAEIKDLGVDTARIHHLVYDNHTVERMRFLGFALSQKLQVLPQFQCAYFAISDKELKNFESRTGDTEGLVNYALSIRGINLAAIFIERNEGIKISFRSIGDFSVAEFSAKYFNGGGHKNAAGGVIRDKDLDDTILYFMEKLKEVRG
jgi:phosphoesterase RecJ-like protein